MACGYGHGVCKAPEGNCPHWQGTFCELDQEAELKAIREARTALCKDCKEFESCKQSLYDMTVCLAKKVSHTYPKQFMNIDNVASGKSDILRDCHRCVYEVGCHENPLGCKKYKRDAPDGGYYG